MDGCIGGGKTPNEAIDEAYENLVAKYEALDFDPNVTITGSNGAVHGSDSYFGTFKFGDDVTYTTKTDGKIHGVPVIECNNNHTYTCECRPIKMPECGTYYRK